MRYIQFGLLNLIFFMLLLILNILLITVCFSFLSLAPWVPTRASDHERVLEILQLKP